VSRKIVVIIASADAGKARAGVLYATNALSRGWMDEVRLVFFGPAEGLLLKDEALRKQVDAFRATGEAAVACKYVADQQNMSADLQALGLQVEFVGQMISEYIHEGFVPMVW